MSNTFLTADTHFGHLGVCQFLRPDGVTKIRPWTDPHEMDEDMVQLWNSVVSPNDRVYHLGDVVINRKALPILHRLNGRKVLIKGNHDIFKLEDYLPYFDDIRGSHKLADHVLTHIPVHPAQLARWCGGNIHGHLHTNRVMHPTMEDKVDPRYLCVSVEHTDFKPISLEDAIARMKLQQE